MTITEPLRVDDLRALIGQRGAPRPAKFPVNEAMIGLWCDAVGDDNPAYLDPEWAEASRWGGIIAPATSMNMWTLPGYRRIHPEGEPLDIVTQALNVAGYTSVAAVNNDHDYVRPLRPGDQLSQVQYLGGLTGPKRTRLGEGYFFDIVSEFITAEGETVGRAMMRIFKWAPRAEVELAPVSSPSPAVEPVASSDPAAIVAGGPLAWSDLRVGATPPPWEMPLTATRIIALAAATLDFNDVHFERDAAVRAGAADIYMNILGSCGLMNRYLTDWAGPSAGLRSTRVTLRGQNHPGDIVTFTGQVTGLSEHPDEGVGLAEIAVQARNARGPHLDATVTLELPL